MWVESSSTEEEGEEDEEGMSRREKRHHLLMPLDVYLGTQLPVERLSLSPVDEIPEALNLDDQFPDNIR